MVWGTFFAYVQKLLNEPLLKKGVLQSFTQKIKDGCMIFFQGDVSYNAYDRDIAIVTIFFGDSTVFGKFSIAQRIFPNTI